MVFIQVPIPDSLTALCLPPVPPNGMTYGQVVIYAEQLLTVIEQCNIDKQAIRGLQNE